MIYNQMLYTSYEVPRISFTINDVSYYANEGMNIWEWSISDYNIDGFYVLGNYLYKSSLSTVKSNGNNVFGSNLIQNGDSYTYGQDIIGTGRPISFTIDEVSCNSVARSTWEEWVYSPYNTGGFYIDDNGNVYKEGFVWESNGSPQTAHNTIVSGGVYIFENTGLGGTVTPTFRPTISDTSLNSVESVITLAVDNWTLVEGSTNHYIQEVEIENITGSGFNKFNQNIFVSPIKPFKVTKEILDEAARCSVYCTGQGSTLRFEAFTGKPEIGLKFSVKSTPVNQLIDTRTVKIVHLYDDDNNGIADHVEFNFQYDLGMTWGDFIYSSYNNNHDCSIMFVEGGNVLVSLSDSSTLFALYIIGEDYHGINVYTDDLILPNRNYTTF